MGTCCSSRLQVLLIKYKSSEFDAHFLPRMQLEMVKKKLPQVEEGLVRQVRNIESARLNEIKKEENKVEQDYQAQLKFLRADSAKVLSLEQKHNMNIEEIIGLIGKRRQFSELRAIFKQNIMKAEKAMLEDVHRRVKLYEAKLQKREQKGQLKLNTADLKIIERQFKDKRKESIQNAEQEVDEELSSLHFDNYTKSFLGLLPTQELLALGQSNRWEETDTTEQIPHTDQYCCCFSL